ncbi:hypothetical protein ACFSR6_09125 [Pedobacter vanadiisoli]|uniref:Uncharacterized protein n=1 Tax=Pedobacter vanadiisoli TaxID=1761975 RepID=A0ABW5MJJ1_9SPHI
MFKGFGNGQFLSCGGLQPRYHFKSSPDEKSGCGLFVLSGLVINGSASKRQTTPNGSRNQRT